MVVAEILLCGKGIAGRWWEKMCVKGGPLAGIDESHCTPFSRGYGGKNQAAYICCIFGMHLDLQPVSKWLRHSPQKMPFPLKLLQKLEKK